MVLILVSSRQADGFIDVVYEHVKEVKRSIRDSDLELSECTLSALRDMCLGQDLSKTGSKAVLKARLLEAMISKGCWSIREFLHGPGSPGKAPAPQGEGGATTAAKGTTSSSSAANGGSSSSKAATTAADGTTSSSSAANGSSSSTNNANGSGSVVQVVVEGLDQPSEAPEASASAPAYQDCLSPELLASDPKRCSIHVSGFAIARFLDYIGNFHDDRVHVFVFS